jgi:hypothetical protein
MRVEPVSETKDKGVIRELTGSPDRFEHAQDLRHVRREIVVRERMICYISDLHVSGPDPV